MSVLLPRTARAVVLAALAGALLCATALSEAAHAASSSKRAERAVKVAAVHKYGIGSKIQVRCEPYKGGIFACGYAASPRAKKAVYVGHAQVNRRTFHVHFDRPVCVGAACKT